MFFTCSIFILQRFFFFWKMGPKASFSDYNFSPSSHFFSQNTRHIYEMFSLYLYPSQIDEKKHSCLLLLKKIPNSFTSRISRGKWARQPTAIFAESPCCLWPLTPAPPLALVFGYPYNNMGLWCPVCAFKCHHCCLLVFSVVTKSGPSVSS